MINAEITFYGKQIKQKHIHYEYYPTVDSNSATVIIRGDVASDFSKKYKSGITETNFNANVEFTRNGDRIKECQDIFKSQEYLIGYLSLENITKIIDV
ncbi:hypothetical protein J4440_05970 [Candidatus Woesearchaeota archaeon]|nr:hypothetical protein [Candidatus Woesearchaeota archaeon]